jgi:hypothetical protein
MSTVAIGIIRTSSRISRWLRLRGGVAEGRRLIRRCSRGEMKHRLASTIGSKVMVFGSLDTSNEPANPHDHCEPEKRVGKIGSIRMRYGHSVGSMRDERECYLEGNTVLYSRSSIPYGPHNARTIGIAN